MKFGKKNAYMPRSLNDFLNEGLLVLEIWLKLEDVFIAAIIFLAVTFLTFPTKPRSEQTMLGQNDFDSLWLVWEVCVI
jgi:hypothetical protein